MYFRTRLTKDAPLSALHVWRGYPTDPDTGETLYERPQLWRAMLNGKHVPIEDVMIEIDGATGLPAIKGEPCDEIEYLRILKTYQWAQEHAPHLPEARPREAINHLAGDTIF